MTRVSVEGTLIIGAGSTGSSPFTASLPSGITISASIYPNGGGTPFGDSTVIQTGVVYGGFVSTPGNPNDTNLSIYSQYASGSVNQLRSLLENDLNNGDVVWIQAELTVQEWLES